MNIGQFISLILLGVGLGLLIAGLTGSRHEQAEKIKALEKEVKRLRAACGEKGKEL